jgi:sugar phosphate isomerase/epimerase
MSPQRLQLAVVSAAVSNDPRQAPTRSREAGFSGLLFDAFSSALNIPDLSGSGRREFRQILSAQDQQLVGLRWDTGPHGLGPGADVDQALSRLDRVMEAAAGLASPLVCVDLGQLPEPPKAEKPRPKVSAQQAGLILLPTAADVAAAKQPEAQAPAQQPADPSFVSQVDGALAELGRRADRYNVTVAFRSELASFAALERALSQARCPWFGVDLDPVSILRDEWDLDETFSWLGSLIRHVRARDAVRGADRRTRPAVVGRGGTNWGQLLENLDSAGYASWITVDPLELPDRPAAAAAARTYILSQTQ